MLAQIQSGGEQGFVQLYVSAYASDAAAAKINKAHRHERDKPLGANDG
jgi:hypothetical protein